MQPKPQRREGFTLVELMIVVSIISLLAVIAVPATIRARESAQVSRFVADLRTAKSAFILYGVEHGTFPPDKQPGEMPDGMDEYLARMDWRGRTSLGGQWDWDYQQFGCKAGVSVYGPTAPASQIRRVDLACDDGNLATGSFRSRSSGYISVIE
jgi:prepilin-type N-terminal cleavage/methylation domain-containing protein